MKNNNNTTGFSILEIVFAMSIFAIFMTGIFFIDNNFYKDYSRITSHNKAQGVVNDVYAYLLTYKKTFGTYDFHTLISQGDSDNNCNGNDFNNNGLTNDEIDEYCFFYPYLDSGVLKFYNGEINSNTATLEDVFLINNSHSGYIGDSYRTIYGQLNNFITIGLKQSTINEDKFSGFIGVYSPDMLGYIYKQEIILE